MFFVVIHPTKERDNVCTSRCRNPAVCSSMMLGSAVGSVIDAPDCCQKTQARFWVPKTPAPKVSHKVWYPPCSWRTVRGGSGQPAGPCVHSLWHPRGLLSGLHGFHSTENTSFSPGTEPMLINKTLEYSDLLCPGCCTRRFISHDLLFSQSLYQADTTIASMLQMRKLRPKKLVSHVKP